MRVVVSINQTNMDKKIILVVEDDDSLREALNKKLLSEGFVVFEAKNGEEGLEISLREHPDLILADILMPRMDGLEMLKKIQEDEWGKTVRFIILTNINDAEEISKAMNLVPMNNKESFEYFVKSDIQIADVVDKVKQKLGLL
jgi:CheY-like chemotaxis protein